MKKNYFLIAVLCLTMLLVTKGYALQQSPNQQTATDNLPKGFPDVNKMSADDYKKAVVQWAKEHPEEYKNLTRLHPSVTPEKLEQMRNEKSNANRTVKTN